MKIEKQNFGEKNGKEVSLFTLQNSNNVTVKITNYGGIITSLLLPDKQNEVKDVVLGFDTFNEYQSDEYLALNPYFGALIGRFGNRIANGKFTIDGQTYKLAQNNNGNHLHGGNIGFDKVVWDAETYKKNNEVGIVLTYKSKDMEEGYPGNLDVKVTYSLNNSNELSIQYQAKTDKKTPVNLTHHSYFNLAGADSGESIADTIVEIRANKYTPVNENLIPTGELADVKNTPFDFTKPKAIGKDIGKITDGYDHNYIVCNQTTNQPTEVAVAYHPKTGIEMRVLTSEPGMQFYTGNFLNGIRGKKDAAYNKHSAFCMETQHFPDSPNQPTFPNTILSPDETYIQHTIYKFSTR